MKYELWPAGKRPPKGWAKSIPGHYGGGGGQRRVATWTSSSYRSWMCMVLRCCFSSHKSYVKYGGIGIQICERWIVGTPDKHGFLWFLEDMGERPAGTSLDRIDNDGNYEPGNCRWASRAVQSINRGSHVGSTSRFKGVSWRARNKKWVASIKSKGKNFHIGYYSSEVEAALAYNRMAILHHGPDTVINEVEDGTGT